MQFRAIAVSVALSIAASPTLAPAQTHIVGYIAGATGLRAMVDSRVRVTVDRPVVGATSTIELNSVFAIGAEASYFRRDRIPVRLHYFETPLFARVTYPASRAIRPFLRLGVAPAIEVHCAYDVAKDTWRGVYQPQGNTNPLVNGRYVFSPEDFTRNAACYRARQHTFDLGLLSAIGATLRRGLREYGLEVRVTNGLRDLSAGTLYSHTPPVRNRSVSLLFSSATRVF